MAKKKKKDKPEKEMSEGTAIVVVVIGVAIGGIALYYLLSWFIGIFFPGLFN